MAPFSDAQTRLIASRAHALTDVTRIRILDVLARAELPVGKVAAALALEPSTISKHLQVLHRAGFVERRRSASTVIYSLLDARVLEWCRYLARLRVKGWIRPPGVTRLVPERGSRGAGGTEAVVDYAGVRVVHACARALLIGPPASRALSPTVVESGVFAPATEAHRARAVTGR